PDSFAVAALLIEAGANVRAKRTGDIEVVLDRAVTGGDRRTIDLLLARGAAKDKKSASAALGTAAFRGDTSLVDSLLANGADPNESDNFAGHAMNLALLGE